MMEPTDDPGDRGWDARCTRRADWPSLARSTPTATSSSRPISGRPTSSPATATGRCASWSATTVSKRSRSGASRRKLSRRGSVSVLGAMGDPDLGAIQKDPERTYLAEAPFGSMDPGERLELLDAEGIDAAVLYTTIGLLWEAELDDPELSQAYTRAYNRWICEFCARPRPARPHRPPVARRPRGRRQGARTGRGRGGEGRVRRRRSPTTAGRWAIPTTIRCSRPRRTSACRSRSTRPSSRSGRRARGWARGSTSGSCDCWRR